MESSRTDDILFNREKLEEYNNDQPDIYFFTPRQVVALLSLTRYLEWESRWTDRDIDNELAQSIIRELTMLNAKHLVKTQLILMAAITGRQIDLTSDVVTEQLIDGYWDFSEDGLVPTMGGGSVSYEDELVTIADNLGAAVTILGGVL